MAVAGYEEGVRYVAAACGDVVSFLLRSDGIVNVSGSTWLGEDTITSPVGFTAVAAGLHHVVLLRCDGMVETYDPSHGDYFGVLGGNGPPGGIGGVVERPGMPDGVSIIAIAADLQHSIFLRSDGHAFAFGTGTRVPELPNGMFYVNTWARRRNAFLIMLKSESHMPLALIFRESQVIFRNTVAFL